MSGRCADCKHWGVPGTYVLPDGVVRNYSTPWFREGFKQCIKLEESLDQDGEPCTSNAHLGTEGAFGCLLWEGKE